MKSAPALRSLGWSSIPRAPLTEIAPCRRCRSAVFGNPGSTKPNVRLKLLCERQLRERSESREVPAPRRLKRLTSTAIPIHSANRPSSKYRKQRSGRDTTRSISGVHGYLAAVGRPDLKTTFHQDECRIRPRCTLFTLLRPRHIQPWYSKSRVVAQ